MLNCISKALEYPDLLQSEHLENRLNRAGSLVCGRTCALSSVLLHLEQPLNNFLREGTQFVEHNFCVWRL